MKIVVAVDTDKQTIVKKTGQAAFFAIYENEKVVDFIPNYHGEGNPQGGAYHKHENEHRKGVMGLVGCDVILVQAVGENMREALESIGLKVQKIRKKDGTTADEVVQNFLNDNL